MKLIFLLCLMISSIIANDYSKGEDLIKNKQYTEAGDFFIDLYMRDDSGSGSYLGELYAYHYTTMPDHCNAATYFLFQGMKEKDCRSFLIISNMYKDNICLKNNTSKDKYIKYMDKYNACLNIK